MGVQGEAMGTTLLRELDRRMSATPMQAGEAVGLDALEVATAMTWLIQQGLVRLDGGTEPLWDPYTNDAITPTNSGYRYLDEHRP